MTSENITSTPASSLPLAEKWVTLIGIPILLVLGTAGNGLVIIVLSVRKLRPHPTSLMLVFLAVFDTMVLWTGHFRMLYRIHNPDFRANSNFLCKFHTQLTYFSVSISVWLLVLVTSHRLIAVYFPLQAKTLLTMRRTVISLAILIIGLFLFNAHIYWTVGLLTSEDPAPPNSTEAPSVHVYCYHTLGTNFFMTKIWPKLDLITNSIIPFVVLLLCNCTIIYKVRAGSKILNKESKDSKSQKANTAMTVMLLSVNVIFLITTGPYALYNTDIFRAWVPLDSDKDYFIYTLLYVVAGINSASNFYIYCLSGQKFREELKMTFLPSHRRKNDSLRTKTMSGHSRAATMTSRHAPVVGPATSCASNTTVSTVTSNGHVNVSSANVSNGGNESGGVVNPACDEEMVTKL